MLVLLQLALLAQTSFGFFFPMGGSGCQCAQACPKPVTCAPVPTCAIPLPCPTQSTYAAPAPTYQAQYENSWQNGVSAQYQLPPSPPVSTSYQVASYQNPADDYQTAQSYYRTINPIYTPTYQTPEPGYEAVQPIYQTIIPSPVTHPVAPQPLSYNINPVQPIEPVETVSTADSYATSVKAGDEYPTLTPSSYATSPESYSSDAHLQSIAGTAYDDSAPALPPPPPPPITASESVTSIDYEGASDTAAVGIQDNEAHLAPSSAAGTAPELVDENGNSIERMSSHHSQQNAANSLSGSATQRGRFTTEGFTPYLKYKKRHWVLKRLKNARQFAAVPRTTSTCNSEKLANVMIEVMSDDVSVSKRAILQSTETAFNGDKYDVFCATGEFSYSIHSRKYCEVTKNAVTCFAFR